MKAHRALIAAILAASIGIPIEASPVENGMTPKVAPVASTLPVEGRMPPLDGATEWLNSRPLTVAGLRGKVVVVEFWTYSCVNWLRTLPYVRAWAKNYAPDGLVVVGVHSPEFDFEHAIPNVRRAAADMQITYPIAIDNNFAVWRAFKNEYWPALYFVDAQGRVRHHHFGEGGYARSEAVIRQLLTEAGSGDLGPVRSPPDPRGLEVPADAASLKSPETYVGYARAQNFSSPGGAVAGKPKVYDTPAQLGLNQWALTGNWTIGKEAAELNAPGGRITFGFHARDLNLVMTPAPGKSARFRVLIDGQPPGDAHGADVDRNGYGTLAVPRTYQLIRQPQPIVDRLFEIQFLEAGHAAYDFTFG